MTTKLTAAQKAELALQEQEALEAGIEPSEEAETETDKDAPEQAKPEMTHNEWLNERVPFQAFYDGEKYKDDIVVTVNGINYQIQRGELVMIPRFVAMAVDDAEAQMKAASRTSQGFEAILKRNQAANMM